MLRLLVRRLLLGVLTLWVVSALVFAGTEILPGDVAQAILGQSATEETVAAIRKALNLDRPPTERYLDWLGGLLTGELGDTLATGRPVAVLVGDRLGRTLLLAALTAIFAVPLALGLGLIAAMYPNSGYDRGISVGSLCLISVPGFFIAAVLVIVFAVSLRWLPAIAHVSEFATFGEKLRALALPIMTLTATMMAQMTRMTRAAVLGVLTSPYIETALLKGAPRRRIILRHALPNALSPIIIVVALNLAYLVSGVVVVEVIFAYPGLGKLLVDAVASRDIPLVQGSAMVFCATYVGLNLLADLLAITANPRLRHPK